MTNSSYPVQVWAITSPKIRSCVSGYHPAAHETFPFCTLCFQQQSPYPGRGLEEGDGTRAPRAVLAPEAGWDTCACSRD